MKLAIYWDYYQRYHCARANAAISYFRSRSDEVLAVSLGRVGRDGHQVDLSGYAHLPVTYIGEKAPTWKLQELICLFGMIRLYRKESVNVVTVMGWNSLISFGLLIWAKLSGVKTILMLEGQAGDCRRDSWKEKIKSCILNRLVDSVFCGGKRHKEYAEILGSPAERIFTGYDCVDNSYWSTQSAEIRQDKEMWEVALGLEADKYFLSIGRFIEKKNFDGLVCEYADYVNSAQGRIWPLVIIGDGSEMPKIKSLIAEHQLDGRVILPGYLVSEEIAPYLALCGVFILPSSHYEQWGLVVNEAMACAKPVLVSEVCGCVDDLVLQGGNGFRFDADQIGALSKIMLQISSGDFDYHEMGHLSEKHIAKYSELAFAQQLHSAAK